MNPCLHEGLTLSHGLGVISTSLTPRLIENRELTNLPLGWKMGFVKNIETT